MPGRKRNAERQKFESDTQGFTRNNPGSWIRSPMVYSMEWTADYSDFAEGKKTQRFRQSPGKKDKNPRPSLNLRENFFMILGTINVEARRINLRFN
jgi:hypothetical protein